MHDIREIVRRDTVTAVFIKKSLSHRTQINLISVVVFFLDYKHLKFRMFSVEAKTLLHLLVLQECPDMTTCDKMSFHSAPKGITEEEITGCELLVELSGRPNISSQYFFEFFQISALRHT